MNIACGMGAVANQHAGSPEAPPQTGLQQHVRIEGSSLLKSPSERSASPFVNAGSAIIALLTSVPFGSAAASMLLCARHSQATGQPFCVLASDQGDNCGCAIVSKLSMDRTAECTLHVQVPITCMHAYGQQRRRQAGGVFSQMVQAVCEVHTCCSSFLNKMAGHKDNKNHFSMQVRSGCMLLSRWQWQPWRWQPWPFGLMTAHCWHS